MGNKIHLTSKTAIDLRKNAARMRQIYNVLAVVLSVVLCAASVFLGMKWLPAVPLLVMLTAALDVMLVICGRSVYLTMIGQAICTEAAAREIHAGMSESRRRERAITDLIDAKADAQRTGARSVQRSAQPFFEPEKKPAEPDEEEDENESMQVRPAVRRRRRSDGLKLIKSGQAK